MSIGRALLLHGLTGTPWEVEPLGEALALSGFSVSAPLLAGHGVDLPTLESTDRSDWYRCAERELDRLNADGERVLVFGFSMGALLALLLAAHHPQKVAALAIAGVPLTMPLSTRILARWLSALRRTRLSGTVGYAPKRGIDVKKPHVAAHSPSLRAFPYRSIVEMDRLQREVRPLLKTIHVPVLLLHARRDHAAPLSDMHTVARALGTSDLRTVVLENSYHLVGRDLDSEQAARELVAFAHRVCPHPARSP